MRKTLIIIDMQNDFVTGSLANEAAYNIIPGIKKKIKDYINNGDEVVFTRDTHSEDYLNTPEGKKLPVEHCIKDTFGWQIVDDLFVPNCEVIDKPSFGYPHWTLTGWEFDEIELVGTCTDICVISNALILKAQYPFAKITVDASCCAGLTEESHRAAIEVMKNCQIEVINE